MSARSALALRFPRSSLLALATALVCDACSKPAPKPPNPPVPVVVATVHRADVPYRIQANGVVSPISTSAVTPQVDGLITHVYFREGQEVAKGAVLFQIEPRPYQAAYQQALANLARDRQTLANALREVQRYEDLVKRDYVTQEQADQQRTAAATAQAVVQADEGAVENAKFNLDNTKIRAPIAGRTGGLLVRAGNVVHANASVPLVVINQISPILVRFPVPATDLPLIQHYGTSGQLPVTAVPGGARPSANDTAGGPPGMQGGGYTTANGDAAAGSDSSASRGRGVDPSAVQLLALLPPARGTLYFIDNAVDTLTGTVLLKASFANMERTLWSGQFVSTTLHLFVERNALVVPMEAVVTGQQGTYVYVIDSGGVARQRKVSVERSEGNVSVITAGLREGERVVRIGQSRLTAGAKVRIVSEGAADSGRAPSVGADSAAARRPRAGGATGASHRPATQ